MQKVEHFFTSGKFDASESKKDTLYRSLFLKITLQWVFGVIVRNEYPVLAEKAIKVLLLFCRTYLCEKGFSTCTYPNDKCRNSLNTEPDLKSFRYRGKFSISFFRQMRTNISLWEFFQVLCYVLRLFVDAF